MPQVSTTPALNASISDVPVARMPENDAIKPLRIPLIRVTLRHAIPAGS